MMKFNKEFRDAHPETIGETDSAFDMANYAEWLEQELVNKNDLLQRVSLPKGTFVPIDVKLPKGPRPISVNTQSGKPVTFRHK